MLEELAARNLGIIADARLDPSPRFTVITGETGAGKTLLLGAIRLLLGGSAGPDLVGPWADDATAEGRFVGASGAELGASRRLSKTGRSRAYIDGSIASAAALDAATDGLIEIIGQHDQLRITRPAEARRLVDRMLSEEGAAAAGSYRQAWEELRRLTADREAVGGDRTGLERELDLALHQVAEITAAQILPGEDRDLEDALSRLRNLSTLREHADTTVRAIEAAREETGSAVAELRRAKRHDPHLATLLEALEALESQLGDVTLESSAYREALEVDDLALERSEARARLLSDLKRRYGPGLEQVLDFAASATERAEELQGLLQRSTRIDTELAHATQAVETAGAELRDHRRRAALRLAAKTETHLRDLGFVDPAVEIVVEDDEPGPAGSDRVTIEFASDRRLATGNIARIASGGELSRLVLALRLAGGAGEAETLVFDEIDAGVGGATALALGEKIAQLAQSRQILCVTHLPQVAAFADVHYSVTRSDNAAVVERVDADARLEELARMLAGLPDSERGRQAAGELLELASRV